MRACGGAAFKEGDKNVKWPKVIKYNIMLETRTGCNCLECRLLR